MLGHLANSLQDFFVEVEPRVYTRRPPLVGVNSNNDVLPLLVLRKNWTAAKALGRVYLIVNLII